MPIHADPGRPVRVYDTSGNLTGTESSGKPTEVKTVDRVGRAIERAEAAEKASDGRSPAATPAGAAASPAASGPQTPSTQPGTAAETPAPTAAEVRKTWLEAQRAHREAQAAQKRAKASLEKAEAFEKAKALAESGEDPTALIKAAGLDPVKFYQEMTKYALSDKGKAEADPQARVNAEHTKQLKELAERNEALEREIQAEKDYKAHAAARGQFVDPVIRGNQEKYEVLIAQYGGVDQAVNAVYETMYELYRDTGVMHKAEDLATAMDAHWQERIGQGLETTRKLKRFAGKFAQNEPAGTRDGEAPTREPRRSVTLSNRVSAPVPNTIAPPPRRYMSKDERIEAALKRFPEIP